MGHRTKEKSHHLGFSALTLIVYNINRKLLELSENLIESLFKTTLHHG